MEEYIWSIQESHRLRAAEAEADDAASRASENAQDIGQLASQVNRLTLACQAMWEIIRDKTDITEGDLTRKIEEIDLRDGVADGKLGPITIECKSCGRNSNSRRPSCIWCGAPIERIHAFEG